MNYMEQVAEMLGVEYQTEKFEIYAANGNCLGVFTLDSTGLVVAKSKGCFTQEWLVSVLYGVFTIKKLPWVPKECESFYSFDIQCECGYKKCVNFCIDTIELMQKRGAVFYRTEEEVRAAVKELGWEVE